MVILIVLIVLVLLCAGVFGYLIYAEKAEQKKSGRNNQDLLDQEKEDEGKEEKSWGDMSDEEKDKILNERVPLEESSGGTNDNSETGGGNTKIHSEEEVQGLLLNERESAPEGGPTKEDALKVLNE